MFNALPGQRRIQGPRGPNPHCPFVLLVLFKTDLVGPQVQSGWVPLDPLPLVSHSHVCVTSVDTPRGCPHRCPRQCKIQRFVLFLCCAVTCEASGDPLSACMSGDELGASRGRRMRFMYVWNAKTLSNRHCDKKKTAEYHVPLFTHVKLRARLRGGGALRVVRRCFGYPPCYTPL